MVDHSSDYVATYMQSKLTLRYNGERKKRKKKKEKRKGKRETEK